MLKEDLFNQIHALLTEYANLPPIEHEMDTTNAPPNINFFAFTEVNTPQGNKPLQIMSGEPNILLAGICLTIVNYAEAINKDPLKVLAELTNIIFRHHVVRKKEKPPATSAQGEPTVPMQ